MFALLAFLCLPAFALAEDSSSIEYRDAPPSIPGQKSGGTSANSSEADGGGSAPSQSSTAPGTSGGDPSDEESSSDKSGAAGGKGNGNGGNGNGGAPTGKSGVGAGKVLDTADEAPISHESSSSPLVPILIALAILAAISIGFVAYKRRRQDPGGGSAVSPEAG